MRYKALTLTQPWATLVAIDAKRIETRSWATSYRGPLLIHAAAGLGPVGGMRGLRALIEQQPFNRALCDVGSNGMIEWWGKDIPEVLPRGAIVALAELRDVRIIGRELNGDATIAADDMISFTPILGNERAFGDYTPGRYAWLLANVRPLAEPIPAKGALGLWNWEGDLPSALPV
jgi:hypothetical protein